MSLLPLPLQPLSPSSERELPLTDSHDWHSLTARVATKSPGRRVDCNASRPVAAVCSSSRSNKTPLLRIEPSPLPHGSAPDDVRTSQNRQRQSSSLIRTVYPGRALTDPLRAKETLVAALASSAVALPSSARRPLPPLPSPFPSPISHHRHVSQYAPLDPQDQA